MSVPRMCSQWCRKPASRFVIDKKMGVLTFAVYGWCEDHVPELENTLSEEEVENTLIINRIMKL